MSTSMLTQLHFVAMIPVAAIVAVLILLEPHEIGIRQISRRNLF